jgi:hypothetical protein
MSGVWLWGLACWVNHDLVLEPRVTGSEWIDVQDGMGLGYK